MTKNKKNLIIGLGGSVLIFLIGILYMVMPSYYGLDEFSKIDTNNLFISLIVVISAINIGFYYIMGANPTHECAYISMSASATGILNTLLINFLPANVTLSVSIITLTVLLSLVKLLSIRYYKKINSTYYYIDLMLLFILLFIGVIISFSLFDNSLVQTFELSFLLIVISIITGIETTLKSLFNKRGFLKNIRF